MTEEYVAAIDQGTTSSRCIIFDSTGSPVSVAQREHRQIFPRPGWVEHDAEEIWETQLRAARGALAKGGASASDVAAIGITNQRETAVVWERASGAPIHRAIVWQSRPTVPRLALSKAETAEALGVSIQTVGRDWSTAKAWLLREMSK